MNQPKQNKHKKKYWWIAIVLIVVIVGGLIGTKLYINSAMKPVNSEKNTAIQVKIPMGASNQKIGQILEKHKVIQSSWVFQYYIKTHNKTSFNAGYYVLKPSMSLEKVVSQLGKGGSSTAIIGEKGKVLVQEGQTIDEIAKTVQNQTKFSAKEFLALMKNEGYLDSLAQKYPALLSSAMTAKDVRYRLEGYLYPATYDVSNLKNLKSLVNQMVAAENEQLKPYFATMTKQHMSVQEVLTMASLVEREGVTKADRGKIAGVFFNRLDKDMALQSDISVMYALNTHKKNLTYKDLKVDSPYNLYINKGYGPGPFNSPSIESIKAVLNPTQRSKKYLYFIANTKTGKVYYAKNYAQHQKLTDKLAKDNQ